MAQKGIEVVIAIIPPTAPGTSKRAVYDPDITAGLLAYEVGALVKKMLKTPKKRKPKAEPAA